MVYVFPIVENPLLPDYANTTLLKTTSWHDFPFVPCRVAWYFSLIRFGMKWGHVNIALAAVGG